jgi:hypothetical protein
MNPSDEQRKKAFKKTGFNPRPDTLPRNTAYDSALALAAAYLEERLIKLFTRFGWPYADLKAAWDSGHPFGDVRLRMLDLPTTVYLGTKEPSRGTEDEKALAEFARVYGIACGLLGVSGVAGAGEGAMALGQKWHGNGIQLLKATDYVRLFPKGGVAGVALAIREERPNPYVTQGWLVRPTTSLDIRKGRLFSLGVPLQAVFLGVGGDATLDEFTFVKTLTKKALREQIETPFRDVQPSIVLADAAGLPFWSEFLDFYEKTQVFGPESRIARKKAECTELRRGLVQVEDPIAATKKAIKLLDENATRMYGASMVETWQVLNDEDFWKVLGKLAA